jgi:uncharacterized protein
MTKIIRLLLIINLCSNAQIKGQQTILWKIQDTINNKTSYLLGTAHQIGASFIESFPEIDRAMLESSVSIFESIGESDFSIISVRKSHNEIQKILTKKEYKELQDFTNKKRWGNESLNKLESQELFFLLAKSVMEKVCDTYSSSDSLLQLDDYLELKSKNLNKRIIGLETTAMQIASIRESANKATWESQKKNLKALLKILKQDEVNSSLCGVLTKYKNLDFSYNFDGNCPNNALIVKRNEDWLKILPNYLNSDNCFISVGIQHLANKCGLIVQLKEKGYVVTPIKIK